MINEVSNVEPKFEYTCLATQLENICEEMEKDIKRDGVTWYQRADGSICDELLNELAARKLLKPRVHRIKIDTWEN